MADPIFQKSLQDLVKAIRAHKKDPSAFISQAIAEIKTELKTTDPFLKSEAVRKLTYLQMVGYNISWASFAIVEVMSQARFAHKRIGYLAANQSFTESTDVVLLTTNLFKKEFAVSSSTNQYEIGLAINSLANIATKDLARDCISDLVVLMNHTRPYVRKKAVLAMYKLYVKFPQGLRLTFEKLKERLDDSESSVISCAVNVICELSNKNPRNYLTMAPKFFRLLTTSSNNWMLIKVVKLLGSLVSEEPRLARKLLEPLATIIQNTGAKSLQYECIHTITEALPYTKREDGSDAKCAPAVIKLCSDYLRGFIEDSDQNLKYLGLVGLVNLMKSSPRSVVDHRELVLRCLNDDDVTIRIRALELLAGIVSKKSLVDLVHHLLEHARHSEGSYRDEIIAKVLYMCSKQKYELVTDFAWYTSILLDLATMQGSKHGKEVAEQLIEIALRVDTVRPFAVESMLSMLLNDSLILGHARATVSEVLKAASWIVGEYVNIVTLISEDGDDDAVAEGDEEGEYWIEGPAGEDIRSQWRGQDLHVLVTEALLHPRATNLPAEVQCAYVQAAMKVFISSCSDCEEATIASIIGILRNRLGMYLQSISIEVQERASTFRHLLADFDILAMNWQAAAEEVKKEESTGGKGMDLLDLPLYTPGSVKAVDTQGSSIAKSKCKVLSAITAETFYAVHAKAQRKVPVPENLDLGKAFNNSALTKLLNVDIPENLNLATLSFAVSTHSSSIERDRPGDDDDRYNSKSSSSFSESSGGSAPSYSSFQGNDHGGSSRSKNVDDNLFYLSSVGRNNSDIIPLSQVLADTFEEKKGKKVKGGKKAKKPKSAEVNTQEMLPAGAMSSDDEKGGSSKKKEKSSLQSKKNKTDDLENVDITTPLRADEVLTVPKHREVPAYDQSKDEEKVKKSKKEGKKGSKEGEDTKKKKSKKSKDVSSKSEKKSSKTSNVTSAADDLLSFDWASAESNDLDMGGGSSISAISSGTEKPKKDKKSKATGPWVLMHSDKTLSIYYAVCVSGNSIFPTFKVSNKDSDGPVDVDIAINNPGSQLRVIQNSVNVARGVAVGQESSSVQSLELQSDGALKTTVQIGCTISVTTGSLLGPQSSTVNASFKIFLCSTFSPNKVDESGFAAIISKSSSKWGSVSCKIGLVGKSKTAFKTLASFLHAHIVEAESSKAISMCAKISGGGVVCCLAKLSKDGTSISLEIKSLCSSKTESVATAESISLAVAELSL